MNNRVFFSFIGFCLISFTTVRCGPLSPSVSKFGKSSGSSSSSLFTSASITPTPLPNPMVVWDEQIDAEASSTSESYVLNDFEANQTADLLEELNDTGEVLLPVSSDEVSKIEICCTSDEKAGSAYHVSVKPSVDHGQSVLKIKLKKDSLTNGHPTQLKQVTIRTIKSLQVQK